MSRKNIRFFVGFRLGRLWATGCGDHPTSTHRMVLWGRISGSVRSAGTVVLNGLRNPGLDLSDPRRFRRMGGQELGRALAPLRSLGHPMPEVERRVRVVARLGHEDEAEMVGLRLLGA